MPSNEEALQYLEQHIPELAQSAVTQAYWASLAAGNSVMESVDGVIYEVFPDGSRREVKHIQPPIPVAAGSKRILP